MIKRLTCIECPQGCILNVEMDKGNIVKITGGNCPRGEQYAAKEIKNPVRILTTTVLTAGLAMKMVPVKTDKPIPKSEIFRAINAIKELRITRPQKVGHVIIKDFLSSGANLVITRDCY